LQKALADTGPTPANLNARHPDFADFAVKIGRALGREKEAVQALRTAEADKSAFCLENDTIGAALLAYLREARDFTGTAAELAPKLIAADKDLDGTFSKTSWQATVRFVAALAKGFGRVPKGNEPQRRGRVHIQAGCRGVCGVSNGLFPKPLIRVRDI
jgi:hypothetical protein